jgi:hypothetical protein
LFTRKGELKKYAVLSDLIPIVILEWHRDRRSGQEAE